LNVHVLITDKEMRLQCRVTDCKKSALDSQQRRLLQEGDSGRPNRTDV